MKTKIWSKPTIIFHWLLVVGMVGAYVLGENEGMLNLHSAFGYMVAVLLLFRVAWGLIGPKYSRFSDFSMGFSRLKKFFLNVKEEKNKYPGHNPAAGWIMLAILIMGVLVTVSGILALAAKDQGFFAFLNVGMDSHTLKEFHEASVNILLIFVVIHLLGLLVDRVFHKESGAFKSMFTGVKNVEAEDVKLNMFQRSFSWIFMLIAIAALAYTIGFQQVKDHSDEDFRQKIEQEIHD